MSVTWQDTSKPNKGVQHEMMMGDMRMYDQERRSYVSTLAASLTGLTLEQVETKLEKLDEGYRAYLFTVNGDKRNFRVSKSSMSGWDGIEFTFREGDVIQKASVY